MARKTLRHRACTVLRMVFGLVGLGSGWRAAHAVSGLPTVIGESRMLKGGAVWIVLIFLFAVKWI